MSGGTGVLEPLPRGFFERPVVELAAALLGQRLVRGRGRARRVARIVETEAYGGQGVDPSAHGFAGPTERCRVMFGPAGRAYVYATQGRCVCMNVSTEGDGRGRAVLIRAAEPLEGVALMRARRLARLGEGPTRRLLEGGGDHELLRGPGKLCVALDVTRADDGADVTAAGDGPYLAAGEPVARVLWTPRVGLNPRSASVGWRWRAFDPDSRAVSATRGAGRASRGPRPRRCPAG